MKTIEELKDILFSVSEEKFSEEYIETIKKASDLSSRYAANYNFSGEGIKIDPYQHSLKVAIILLKEIQIDSYSVVASLLMYCDESVILQNKEWISKSTVELIEKLRKIFSLQINHLDMNAEYFRKMLFNISADIRVLMICLVDRLVSMREIMLFPSELQERFCTEVNDLYAPLAHRIGLYNIYTELLNRAFRYFNKAEYDRIDKIRNEQLELNSDKLKSFVSSIKQILDDNHYNFKIKYRVKSPYSIWNKIENKKVSFEEIYDLFAVRVIFELPESEIDEEIKEIDAKIRKEIDDRQIIADEFKELDNPATTEERRRELEKLRKDVMKIMKSSKQRQKELLEERSRKEEVKANMERSECWNIYALVTEKYTPMISRTRDWVSKPRENGYESLHITLILDDKTNVELQIRSKRMDHIAEYGLASHWHYKEKISTTMSAEKWLEQVRSAIEEDGKTISYVIEEFKPNNEKEDIFVFTPDKELRRMPAGSTILDFAYEIHSQIGNKCVGGIVNGKQVIEKVNGKVVKRIEGGINKGKDYKIQNGETISIITSKTQHPAIDWMNIAVTTKAKYNIRKSLDEAYQEKVDEGKEILKRKFKNWKYDFEENFNDIIVNFGYKFGMELFYDVATEKLNTLKIKAYLDNKDILDKDLVLPPEQPQKAEKQSAAGIKGNMALFTVADDRRIRGIPTKCCENIQCGEEVFGFFSTTGEIKVHRQSCPNATDMKKNFPYRIVDLKWGKI